MQYIDIFLKHLKDVRLSKSTIESYYYILKRAKNYFYKKMLFADSKIKPIDCLEYFKHLEKNETNWIYTRSVYSLIRYFDFLEENRIIFLSPIKAYPLPKEIKRHFKVYDEEYIKNLLDKIDTTDSYDLRTKAMLELAYSSSLRPREIYNLKTTDIDFIKKIVFIYQSKNKKDRVVPVGETALFWIHKYMNEVRCNFVSEKSNNYVFLTFCPAGNKLSYQGFHSAIKRTLKRNKLDRIVAYSLRSSSATHCLLNGMSVLHIQKLLGHNQIKTTQTYLRVSTLNLKKELSTKHPRNKIK